MANRYWNAPIGANFPSDVVEGASDSGAGVCVRVDDAAPATKQNVINALKACLQAVSEDTWPPN